MEGPSPHPERQPQQPPPPPPYPGAWPQPTRGRRLTRRRHGRMVAGVCGGVADYLRVDVTLVRIALVLAVLLGFGSGLVVYIVGWAVMPEE